MKIPEQLKNKNFRFCLLGRGENAKKPFEKDWTETNNYKYNDKKLISHIERGFNFGCVGGYGFLRILDIDNKKLAKEFLKKIETFTIKTGSGGCHFYFFSKYDKNHVLIDELGELRSKNYQCVAPTCKHINGKYYEVLIDKPIKKISSKSLFELIKPYIRGEIQATKKSELKDTSRSGLEYRKICSLLRKDKSREEIYEEMNAYSKWVSATEGYKTLTFEKAEDFILQEQERKIAKLEEQKKEAGEIILEPNETTLSILKDKNLFENITLKQFDKKIVGELQSRQTIFLVTCMRLVENLNKATDNLSINARSGTGKDFISEAVFDIIPEKQKEELIRISPKVLAYTRNKAINPLASWKGIALRLEDLGNSVLNDDGFKVMASASPNKINYSKIVNKGKIIDIEIEGKPSIVLTIANANPKEETLRRFPILYLDEKVNQTKEILKRQGEYAKKGLSLEYNDEIIEALKCLRRIKIRIPFADKLTNLFCPENVIVRTHFPRFLDYIKASCSLHQFQRKKDEEDYYIAEPQDYDIGRIALIKTTSNILMIPLSKLQKDILEAIEKSEEKAKPKSVDEISSLKKIEKLNITEKWLRVQLDYLTSKTFLIKGREKRFDEAGKVIPKPVFVYSFNKMQKLEIPKFKDITNNTSITTTNSNTTISSNTTNKGVIVVNEVNPQELDIAQKNIFDKKHIKPQDFFKK